MALTKAAASAASGVTTTTTTTAVDISGSYRTTLYYSMVQVGAATTAASMRVEISPDGGTTWYDYTEISFGTAADTYEASIELPDDAKSVRIAFTAQSGGTSSTLDAQVGKVTAL